MLAFIKPTKNIALGLQNMHDKFNIHMHLTSYTFKINTHPREKGSLASRYASTFEHQHTFDCIHFQKTYNHIKKLLGFKICMKNSTSTYI
jgi:hypothetical protein